MRFRRGQTEQGSNNHLLCAPMAADEDRPGRVLRPYRGHCGPHALEELRERFPAVKGVVGILTSPLIVSCGDRIAGVRTPTFERSQPSLVQAGQGPEWDRAAHDFRRLAAPA